MRNKGHIIQILSFHIFYFYELENIYYFNKYILNRKDMYYIFYVQPYKLIVIYSEITL